ncbi:MAG: hypothetical protein HRF42_04670 [Candidatus Brocadia sp.]|jgi:signal transduction histidine kinase
MSKSELNTALSELNKRVEELQEVFNVYKKLIASISQDMHNALSILLDKIQSLVEMAYTKNSNPEPLEKIATAILEEINRLIVLKTKLYSLSGMEMKDAPKDLDTDFNAHGKKEVK